MRAFPVVLLALATAVPAQAAIHQYRFTATVNTVVELPIAITEGVFVDSSSMAGPTLLVGDKWTGTLYYDTYLQLSPWQPQQPEGGSYSTFQGNIASTITDEETGLLFGSKLADSNVATMSVHDTPVGGTDFIAISTYASGTNRESSLFLFGDADGSLYSSATPPHYLNLDDFYYASVTYGFTGPNGDFLSVGAAITSLSVIDLPPPVPEPSTYAMLGLGLAALAMRKTFGSKP